MPKFCANLTWLFQEHPLIERIGEAAEAGFDAVVEKAKAALA